MTTERRTVQVLNTKLRISQNKCVAEEKQPTSKNNNTDSV